MSLILAPVWGAGIPCRKDFSPPCFFFSEASLFLYYWRGGHGHPHLGSKASCSRAQEIFWTDILFLAMGTKVEEYRLDISVYLYTHSYYTLQILQYIFLLSYVFSSKSHFTHDIFFYITYCLDCTGVKMTWLKSVVDGESFWVPDVDS